jgi:hypothetical protein
MSSSLVEPGRPGASAVCAHLRQRNPRRSGLLLPCAWPACSSGSVEATLAITRLGEAPASGETEQEPLFVHRRLLILEGGERLFIWHPTQT